MVLETLAIASIIVGIVALTVSTMGAVAVVTAPVVSSPQDKYPINDGEYYDHKRANNHKIHMFSGPSPSPVYL